MSAGAVYPKEADRQKILVERRHAKMARSAQNYIRGNTQTFYEWLHTQKEIKLPAGPPIWICGDCHLGNLGPVSGSKGGIEIAIRDFDQGVIGNPAHDLVRLGFSLASAARASDLPGHTMVRILSGLLEGYAQGFGQPEKKTDVLTEIPKCIHHALRDAVYRGWKDLARENIDNAKPTIPLGKNFWPLSKTEWKDIHALCQRLEFRRLVTALRLRDDDSPVILRDAAYWVKGCSSLGRLRYALLVEIGGDDGEFCLMDVKEAVHSAAPSFDGAHMPRNHAERVVAAAWHASPALGDRMLAEKLRGRPVFIRELLPQDLKLEIKHLSPKEAVKVSRFLGAVVGKAHARQMDADTRSSWQHHLTRLQPRHRGTPSWLWSSVATLMFNHEKGYLDHCHKYA